jgi:Flp pilus assembly protein TadD
MAHSTATNAQVSAPMADPVAVAGYARELLGQGQLHAARRLLQKALQAYPTDATLLRLQQVIEPGRVERKSARYPNRSAELEWIKRNRAQYLNKWVALVGDLTTYQF